MNKQIQRAYDINKVYWHSLKQNAGFELHHIFSRTGIFLCCLHFFVAGENNHTYDYVWVGKMRELFLPDKKKAEANYIRHLGCSNPIFPECKQCLMLQKSVDK